MRASRIKRLAEINRTSSVVDLVFQFYDRSARQWVKIDASGNELDRKKTPAFEGVPKRKD